MASYDSYVKTFTNTYKKKWDEDLAKSNSIYEQQKADIRNNYAGQLAEITSGYDDLNRQNAVQQEINKRQVAENMANLGLTDSGLNRTQLTATQLSYGNNKAKIDEDRQLSVDKLNREMASMLSTVDVNQSNAALSINNSYEKLIADAAKDAYKTDQAAITARIKASAKSSSGGSKSTKTIKNKGFDTAKHMEEAIDALESGDLQEYDRLVKYFYTSNDEYDDWWNNESDAAVKRVVEPYDTNKDSNVNVLDMVRAKKAKSNTESALRKVLTTGSFFGK